jgi:hypothetical protein
MHRAGAAGAAGGTGGSGGGRGVEFGDDYGVEGMVIRELGRCLLIEEGRGGGGGK